MGRAELLEKAEQAQALWDAGETLAAVKAYAEVQPSLSPEDQARFSAMNSHTRGVIAAEQQSFYLTL